MTNIMDKIDYALGLARRIQNEMNSGDFDNALYLTDTFVFLFSGHQAATRDLVTSYTAVSQKLLTGGQLEQAESLVSKGLTIDPQNSQLLSILVETKKAQHQALKNFGRPPAAEPDPFILPFTVLNVDERGLHIKLIEGISLSENKAETLRLPSGCLFVDGEGREVLPHQLLLPRREILPQVTHQGALYARQLPVVSTIKYADQKGGKIRELDITIEHEGDQVILSLALRKAE